MQIRRAALLVVSAVLLSAALLSIRGISYVPTVEPTAEDPSTKFGLSRYAGQEKIVELRADVSLPEHAFKHLEALNETFMKQHPNFRVSLHNREPSSAHEEYMLAFRLGNAADILLMDGEEVLKYAVTARLAPADDYYASDAETIIMPALVSQLKWNGYIWGIPLQMDPYVLAYHKEQWQALTGDSEPSSTEQIAEVYRQQQLYAVDSLAYAALLTSLDPHWLDEIRQEDLRGDNLLEETLEGAWQEILEEPEVSKDPEDLEELLEDAAEVEDSPLREVAASSFPLSGSALSSQAQQPLAEDELEAPLFFASTNDAWRDLLAGKIAGMIVPLSEYEQHMASAIEARLIPSTDGKLSALLTGQSFVLSADSPYQEEAFRWIRSISQLYHEKMSLNYTNGYPVVMDHYEQGIADRFATFPLLLDCIRYGSALAADPRIPDKLEALQHAVSSRQVDEEILEMISRIADIWNGQETNDPEQSQ